MFHTGVVEGITLSIAGSRDNERDSHVTVTSKDLLRNDLPITDGIYDPHMGTTDYAWLCKTCEKHKMECPGHFGTIRLNYPVKNPIFRTQCLKWLKSICHHCGNLVLKKTFNVPLPKKLNEHAKNVKRGTKCHVCSTEHPGVSSEKNKGFIFYVEHDGKHIELFDHEIYEILDRIPDDVVVRAGRNPISHPRNLILYFLRVPPNTIRPEMQRRRVSGNKSSSNDTTVMLRHIMDVNSTLRSIIPPKNTLLTDVTTTAQYHILDLLNYDMVKGSSAVGNTNRVLTNLKKQPLSIARRLPKKHGRIRENLLGKRINFIIRSVITGDPIIKIDEVGIPKNMAKRISIPSVVREYNYDQMNAYFLNNTEKYPGCSGVIKKNTKKFFRIEHLKDYTLQNGDTIFHDLVDGIPICLGRQPSLSYQSITQHRTVVIDGNTIRINPCACKLYNADFDGDTMTGYIATNIQSINEIQENSNMRNWFISYKTIGPTIVPSEDTTLGLSRLSRSNVAVSKWHAMMMFAYVDMTGRDLNFNKPWYTGREIISSVLPSINLVGKRSSMYLEQYNHIIKYDPDDIVVNIVQGRHLSGILDSANIGTSLGSLFHLIYLDKGADAAFDTLYTLNQISASYLLHNGFSIGIEDLKLPAHISKLIDEDVQNVVTNAKLIIEKLNSRTLTPPLGVSLQEYLESELMGATDLSDKPVDKIVRGIDFFSNVFSSAFFSGAKGKGGSNNLTSIYAAIGMQSQDGRLAPRNVSFGRTSPYYSRFDFTPEAIGFIMNSYRDGIPPESIPFAAAEARFAEISNALSTSIPGGMTRMNVKNLESIKTNNLKQIVKDMNIVQVLYGDMGFDIRCFEKVKFITATLSDADMKEWHTKAPKSDKKLQALLDQEFQQLLDDRIQYRAIFLDWERYCLGSYIFTDTSFLPCNIHRRIENILIEFKSNHGEDRKLWSNSRALDLTATIRAVRDLCEYLPYIYSNENQYRKRAQVPIHLQVAAILPQILIRTYLSTHYLLKKKFTHDMLDILVERIKIDFKRALVDSGLAIGIIAAQCLSEPITQYVLNSKHRASGGGGTQMSKINRLKEILGARDLDQMTAPQMTICVWPEYEADKVKVQEIANHIEMLKFERFLVSIRIFYEEYGRPVHSQYVHERQLFFDFEKFNLGIKIPSNLTKLCIRFELDREELITKNIKLETVVRSLQISFPQVFFMYSPENSENVVVRAYLKNACLKASYHGREETLAREYADSIRNTVVRGIDGIYNTRLQNTTLISQVDEDGSIGTRKIWTIVTNGSNLEEVLMNPYVDFTRTQTDCVPEYMRMYGIEAARLKLIYELRKELGNDCVYTHINLFADEMTYTGDVTGIQASGLQKREASSICLRMSQSPLQVLEEAAINTVTDKTDSISGALVMGSVPRIGTCYNQIIINDKFIRENSQNVTAQLDADL